ncbi:hypothetical protein RFI_14937 [Reticulomyxa filosa]|uniref:USP8 dimerisation domain-containing protein n=1 Tax=Reticulomyxa filosa TaxID=46433 RepID=X6N8M6_RETFI|nr:hypothetical protein RFI_14937 [Reticulomyxa filosa]|eukprot:ETO22263.1 hypothetical protein RFI_14937 [Reticulomyxa filosa]
MKFKSGEDFVRNLVSEYCPEPNISNTIRLETYYKKAHNLFHESSDLVKMGEANAPHAYVVLMRLSQLIAALQNHSSYNMKEYAKEKQLNMRRLKNAILKMEELKPRRKERIEKGEEEEGEEGEGEEEEEGEEGEGEEGEEEKEREREGEKEGVIKKTLHTKRRQVKVL